jgi:uncharacterized protein YndB with AHSA1/START domain
MTTNSAPGDYGTIVSPGTVRIERLLPGPIERIWSYLTDSDKRRLWMASGAIELCVGGKADHVFRNSNLAEKGEAPPPKYAHHAGEVCFGGHVRECRPPRVLAYTWNDGSDDPSEVRFELSERADKVLLVVTHRQLAQREMMISVAGGWHAHLDILRDLLEARRPSGGFWATHASLEAEYEQRIPSG